VKTALNRFAWLTAAATFLLVVAGALVTSHRAGLSVPDWPTTYGRFMFAYPVAKWVGGIRYEHVHRLIASVVGMLTVVLAFWLVKARMSRGLRWLGIGALAAVIVQGLLGGLTVLHYLPPSISAAHGTLAQTFFCITLTIALLTSHQWETGAVSTSPRAGLLRALTLFTTLCVYGQLILGAIVRHSDQGVLAHIAGAVLVFTAISGCATLIMLDDQLRVFYWHGLGMVLLVSCQFGLGVATLVVRAPKSSEASLTIVQTLLPTIHVAVGALLLAGSLMLTLKSFRFLKSAGQTGVLPLSPQTVSS
jgi:cytochrome c oxidase assembly protein subunit 15